MRVLDPPRQQANPLSLAPAILGVIAGFGVAGAADSLGLRALGLLVAGIAFLLVDVASLTRSLVALMVLEIPLQIDTYIGYDVEVAELNTLSGFNLSVTTFILIVLYGLWLAQAAAKTTEPVRRVWGRVIPAFAYLGAVSLSLTVASNLTFAQYEIWLLVQALLLMVFVVHTIRDASDAMFLSSLIVIGLAIQSVLALGQAAFGLTIDIGPFASRSVGDRVASTVGSPNTFGSYLGLVLPLSLMLGITHPRPGFRLFARLAFLAGTVALLLSFSRGAWAGFLVSMGLVLAVMVSRGWIRLRKAALLALAALIPLVVLAGEAIAARVTGGSPADVRLFLMEVALRMIGDNPLLGVGANNFAAALPPYLTSEASAFWVSTVHNKYLLVWAETGIIGLAAFLWLLWMGARRAWRTVSLDSRGASPLALGLLSGLSANLVHMNFDLFHGRPQTHMLWLVLGLIVGLDRVAGPGPDTEKDTEATGQVAGYPIGRPS